MNARKRRKLAITSFARTLQLKRIENPKNKARGKPKRTLWLVGNPDDRAAFAAIGEPCVRGWREGEEPVRVRHTRSLAPGVR